MDILFLIVFIFMMIIMVLIGIIVIGYVWLSPVMGYVKAKWQKKDLVILVGKDNKIRMIPAKYSSGLYSTSKPPYSFIQRIPKSYRLGDLSCVFVHDGWGIVLDPDMIEALKTLSSKGYTTYESLKKAVADGELQEDDVIRIHAFKDIDFHAIEEYIGDMSPGQIRAHIDEKMAEFIEQYKAFGSMQTGMSSNMMVMLVLVAIIGLVALRSFGIL